MASLCPYVAPLLIRYESGAHTLLIWWHHYITLQFKLVQKTLIKWGENDFLNWFMIQFTGGRFKKLSLILSLHPLPDLKSVNLNRVTPFKIL